MPVALTKSNSSSRLRALAATKGPEQRTQAWFDARMNAITCSDIAAVLGMNKYCSREDVMKKKLGFAKFTGNAACTHGTLNEDKAIEHYESITNDLVADVDFGLRKHKKFPFIAGSPDGITLSMRLLEIKCPYYARYKKITSPKEMPAHYVPQVLVLMEIFDLSEARFVQFWPGNLVRDPKMNIVVVKRSATWFHAQVPKLREFVDEMISRREQMRVDNIVPVPIITGDGAHGDPRSFANAPRDSEFEELLIPQEKKKAILDECLVPNISCFRTGKKRCFSELDIETESE